LAPSAFASSNVLHQKRHTCQWASRDYLVIQPFDTIGIDLNHGIDSGVDLVYCFHKNVRQLFG
jgi:hypothetical protein